MKPFACKCLFLLPVILFMDYLILVAFGTTSSIFGAQDKFYCDAYCPLAISLIGASLVFFVWIIAKNNKKEVCNEQQQPG
ncbi:MAG: hypothetical protein ACLFPE_12305 [Bacteroidales bacterium]